MPVMAHHFAEIDAKPYRVRRRGRQTSGCGRPSSARTVAATLIGAGDPGTRAGWALTDFLDA